MSNLGRSVKIHEEKSLYSGFFECSKLNISHSLYAGGESAVFSRELLNRNQAVLVLLYDITKQVVVLVEQFRVGAAQHAIESGQHESAWLVEPVAGMIDEGETAEQAAVREVKEETGLSISELEYILQFYPSPGGYQEILHLYAAEVDSDLVDEYAGNAHEHEDIRVLVMPFSEAKKRLIEASFNVASTFIALQWLFFQKIPMIVK